MFKKVIFGVQKTILAGALFKQKNFPTMENWIQSKCYSRLLNGNVINSKVQFAFTCHIYIVFKGTV